MLAMKSRMTSRSTELLEHAAKNMSTEFSTAVSLRANPSPRASSPRTVYTHVFLEMPATLSSSYRVGRKLGILPKEIKAITTLDVIVRPVPHLEGSHREGLELGNVGKRLDTDL